MKKVETFFRVSKEGNDLQWEMFDCTKMKLFSWLLLVVGCVFLCRKMRCMPIKRCGADFPQWNLYRTILQVTLNTNSLNHSPMRIAWAQTLLSFVHSFCLYLRRNVSHTTSLVHCLSNAIHKVLQFTEIVLTIC